MNRLEAEQTICNTTPVRYFTRADKIELLATLLGGTVQVPREVFDPDEDPSLQVVLSEIGKSERHFERRDPEIWSRFNALRRLPLIEAVDLSDEELELFAQFRSADFRRSGGRAVSLGPGESAVMAIAEVRGWTAILDDGAARRVLHGRCPELNVMTSRELIRASVSRGILSSEEAVILYDDFRAYGYYGPDSLWQ